MRTLISGDYNAFEEGFNGAGVYLISGVCPSRTFERPIYYGSAENLKRRFHSGHLPLLRSGRHGNKPLQNYYTKNGSYNVVIFLVESCGAEEVLEREQYYLDKERPFVSEFRGFNIAKNATSPMKGRKDTEATKERKRISHKNNAKVAENCRKQGVALAKQYSFISPKGEVITFRNLSQFCRDNALPLSAMVNLHKGKGKTCKGWRKA